jgi:glucokinase
MTILLAGDIGGTNTRLKLFQDSGTQVFPLSGARSYSSQNYPSLAPVVDQFLAEVQPEAKPSRACFAIAGPVQDNVSTLTNIDWVLDGQQLRQELGLTQVTLINDFAAIGYGITGLGDNDLKLIQARDFDPQGLRGILGAGTGLGQCFVLPRSPGGVQVFPSEGGHVDFAPRNELEFGLLQYLKTTKQIQRVSVERVVSGQGIVDIYGYLRSRQPEQESARLRDTLDQPETDRAAAIAQAAMEQNDPLAQQTLELFVSAYGAETGNLALKFLPFGGLYIAGGIAAKLLPLMESRTFLDAFLTKGRMSPLLEQMPVAVVLNPEVGLIGAGIRAAQDAP